MKSLRAPHLREMLTVAAVAAVVTLVLFMPGSAQAQVGTCGGTAMSNWDSFSCSPTYSQCGANQRVVGGGPSFLECPTNSGDYYNINFESCVFDASCANPLPTVSFTANPNPVSQGDNSLLTWSSSGAVSCTSPDFSTGGATSGSVNVAPLVSRGYALSCTNSIGLSTPANIWLVVTPPQFNASCAPNRTTALVGESVTWSASAWNGTPPYSFEWFGQLLSGTFGASRTVSYTTPGTKTASIEAVDSASLGSGIGTTVTESDMCAGPRLLDYNPPNPGSFYYVGSGFGWVEDGGTPASTQNTINGVVESPYFWYPPSLSAGERAILDDVRANPQNYCISATYAGTLTPMTWYFYFRTSVHQGNAKRSLWASDLPNAGQVDAAGSVTATGVSVPFVPRRVTRACSATVTVSQPPADLTADTAPDITTVFGSPIPLSITGRNSGPSSTGQPFPAMILRSDWIGGPETIVTLMKDGTARGIPNGFPGNYGEPVPGTFNPPAPGVYFYRLCMDVDDTWTGRIAESNEGNNCGGYGRIVVRPAQPTSLGFACLGGGTQVQLNWSPGAGGAAGYYVRLYNQTTGQQVQTTDFYTGTSITYPITPGHAYSWWVHSYTGPASWSPDRTSDPTYGNFNCSGSVDLTADIGGQLVQVAGQSGTYTGTSRNNGTVASPANFDDLFIFYWPDMTTWVGFQFAAPSASLAGGGGAAGRSVSYTFAQPGTYYYRLCTDWNGEVSEANEGNNCSPFQRVDVRPAPPVGLSHACNLAGTQVTLSWSPGTGGAAGYYVRMHPGAIVWPSAFITDFHTPTSINYTVVPGQAYSWWVHSYTGPASWAPERTSDYTASSFTCPGSADLTAGAITPTTAVSGSPTALSATATNNGTATSGSFPVRFQVQSPVVSLESSYLAGVAPAGSRVATLNYTFPSPGVYQVRACANQNAAGVAIVAESNFGNNCGSWTAITVSAPPQPDLTAGLVTPTTAIAGSPVILFGTATNIGNATAGSFPIGFQVQGPATAYVLSGFGPALAQTAQWQGSASHTFPTAGTYQVRACVNQSGPPSWFAYAIESNYGNNCGSWSNVTVSPAPPTGALSCAVSNTNPAPGDTVTYTVTPSGGASGPYAWNDQQSGSYGTGASVNRLIPGAGPYVMQVSGVNVITQPVSCPVVSGVCASPSATITATPNRVLEGQTTTIAWSATGVDSSCTITGPGVSQVVPGNACAIVPGNATPTISTQSVYRISCDSGESNAEVIVNVIPRFGEF